jgi:hypothetical protein
LPGDWSIQYKEVAKFFEGEEFVIDDDNTGREYRCQIEWVHYCYYYEIWENWHELKLLPNGTGNWLDELPWVIDLIKFFNRLYSELETYRIKKRR